MAATVERFPIMDSTFPSGSYSNIQRESMRSSPVHMDNYEQWQHWSASRRLAMIQNQCRNPDLLAEEVDPVEARHMVLPGAPKKRPATPALETTEMANMVASYYKEALAGHRTDRSETSSVATEDTAHLPVLQRGHCHYFERANLYSSSNKNNNNNRCADDTDELDSSTARLPKHREFYDSNCDSNINHHNNTSNAFNNQGQGPQHLVLDSSDAFEGEVFEDVGWSDLRRSATFVAEQEEILARFKQQQDEKKRLEQPQQQNSTPFYGTRSSRGALFSDDDNSSGGDKKTRYNPSVAAYHAAYSDDGSSDKKIKARSSPPNSAVRRGNNDPDIPDWLHQAARKDGRKIKVVPMNPSNVECKTVCCVGCQKTMLCAANVEVVYCPCCNSIFSAAALMHPGE